MTTPIHILGAGSMGLLLAARLAPVAQVKLIRRPGSWPAQFELTVQEQERRQRVWVEQTTAPALTEPIQRLIVCTKAYDVLPAVEELSASLAPTAALLLIQNGMGSQEATMAALPRASIHAGSSTEGAYRPTADRVVHAGRGITRIGKLQGAEQNWVELLQAAGLNCMAAEPIRWHLADKLRINALINPLTVLHDCRTGRLLANQGALAAMRRLGEEVDAILAAAGYEFADSAFDQALHVARQTAANFSSMLQDARAGRPLELDAITGYLLQLARQHGVDAPAHAALYAQLSRQR